MMEKRLDKPRTGHLPNRKVRSLTNLPFAFPVRDQQASSFGSTVNIICVLVVGKEGTGANTARTPDTETKVERMEIDNEFSDLSEDYNVQEFEFEKGNNYPSVKGRLKKNLIF